MKRLFVLLTMTLFATSSFILNAQENDQAIEDRVPILQERYHQVLDFNPNGFEEGYTATYEVLNHKSIYLDINKPDQTAVLYFNYHPVYQFRVEFPGTDENGPIVLFDGDQESGLIIDRKTEHMSVLHSDDSEHAVSAVTVQKIPGLKLRIVPENLNNFEFRLHNDSGTFRADFFINDFLVFGFDAGLVLEASDENSTCDIWDFVGNSSSLLN